MTGVEVRELSRGQFRQGLVHCDEEYEYYSR